MPFYLLLLAFWKNIGACGNEATALKHSIFWLWLLLLLFGQLRLKEEKYMRLFILAIGFLIVLIFYMVFCFLFSPSLQFMGHTTGRERVLTLFMHQFFVMLLQEFTMSQLVGLDLFRKIELG